MRKQTKHFILYSLIITIVVLTILQLGTSLNPIGKLESSIPEGVNYNLPYGISNYVNKAVVFKPFSLYSGEVATAFTCSLTNNGHIMGTSGSDFKVETATKLFNPIYNAIITPSDGQTLSQVKFIEYLYCQSITGAHPYVTGGSLTMEFSGLNSQGQLIQIKAPVTVNISQAQVDVGTNSIPIATFTVSASEIENALGVTSVDRNTLIQAKTTGSLTFKASTSTSSSIPTATYVIPPLYTGWKELIKGNQPASSQTGIKQYIQLVTPSQSDGNKLVTASGSRLTFKVGVDGWDSKQPSPDVRVIAKSKTAIFLDPDTIVKDIQITGAPNAPDSGTYKQWTYTFDVLDAKMTSGVYVLALQPVTLLNGQTRPLDSVQVVIDSGQITIDKPNQAPTCGDNTIAPNGDYKQCKIPPKLAYCADNSPAPNNDATLCNSSIYGGNGTEKCSATLINQGFSTQNGVCLPNPSNYLPIIQANLVPIIIGLIILAIVVHLLNRKPSTK